MEDKDIREEIILSIFKGLKNNYDFSHEEALSVIFSNKEEFNFAINIACFIFKQILE